MILNHSPIQPPLSMELVNTLVDPGHKNSVSMSKQSVRVELYFGANKLNVSNSQLRSAV